MFDLQQLIEAIDGQYDNATVGKIIRGLSERVMARANSQLTYMPASDDHQIFICSARGLMAEPARQIFCKFINEMQQRGVIAGMTVESAGHGEGMRNPHAPDSKLDSK